MFKVGDKVKHLSYGEGTITNIRDSGLNRITVYFKSPEVGFCNFSSEPLISGLTLVKEVEEKEKIESMFKVGNRVIHPIYGEGIVQESNFTDNDFVVLFNSIQDQVCFRIFKQDNNDLTIIEGKQKQKECESHKQESAHEIISRLETKILVELNNHLLAKLQSHPLYESDLQHAERIMKLIKSFE